MAVQGELLSVRHNELAMDYKELAEGIEGKDYLVVLSIPRLPLVLI